MTATHPTDRELGDFLLGKLDQPNVESHLVECDSCRDRAVAVRADDTFTDILAAARTRLDSQRIAAPTPTLDGLATPPAFAPTLAWDGTTRTDGTVEVPPALAAYPKYRPVRRLGTGGMGTVWLAEHEVMHRPVAVKVIRPDLLARPGATDRFLREVRAAAKLHHPNIVTAFDAEPAGDSCLLVMEYVPGQTLGERLESGPLPVAEACRAVRDAARGLAHAHAHELVHRDVKPHNLIRSADGTIKVLDFGLAGVGAGEGIAASGDGLTGAGMVVGTPDYIAPEQIANPHAADARADIYGLGCTLYHLLAGRPPLPDGSVAEKLAAQPTYEPDPIPGLAADLSAVLAKMLAKRAEDRYQSADEVVDALEDIIDQVRPVHRNPWSCTGKPPSWVMALVVVALTLVAGIVIKIQRDNQVITIETNDPDVEVVMKRKGEVLRVIDKKTGQQWEIDTAMNQIAQADSSDGLALAIPDKDGIVLKRNGKAVFTVSRTPTAAVPAVAKPDRELIQGTWRGVTAEVDGRSMPAEFIKLMKPTLTFTPDKVIGKPEGTIPKTFLDLAVAQGMLPREAVSIVEKGTEGVYHLDPTKTPRQIDFTILGEVKKTGLGIYQLDGDTLKLCLSIDPVKVSERPTEFAARAGRKQVVLTLRRLTPEEIVLEDVERRINPAKGEDKGLLFALLELDKMAVLRFGKWRLAFEGVACDSGGKTLFGVGSFFFPETGGRGNFVDPGLQRPAPMLGQQYNGRANEIVLKNYRFEIEAKGARLVFADKTYEATDQVQTIVIARDGTTRLEPGPKK